MAPIALGLVVMLGVILIVVSMNMGSELDPVQARLQQIAVRPRTLEELELQRPLSERTLKPIIQGISRLLGRFYPANTANSIGLKLKRAGMEDTSTEFFIGVKGFAALVGAVAGSAIVNLLSNDFTFTIGGAFGGLILGFMAPDLYLSSKAGGRSNSVLDQLPDALDLLTISVEAGLGFDAAVVKVTEKMKGPLCDEFKRAAAEQRIGKARQEALRGISERVEVKELQNFISAIIQADQLRQERRQRAEEKAARAPILIMLPTVGCIFPSLFIVILAPAALSALKSCGSV